MKGDNVGFWHNTGWRWGLIGILLLLAAPGITLIWQLAGATNLGRGDFLGYWSAVYLFRENHNPYDPVAMMHLQQTLLHSGLDFVVMAWNPPTLLVFMLPLAWLSFPAAQSTWFIANVVILLTVSLILARLYLPQESKTVLGFCLLAVLFPQAIVAITMGQVTFLVILGLSGCMILLRHDYWFAAGALLILTTVKPHMAVLAVIYLLLYMAYRGKWQGWAGLAVAAGFCVGVLFLFRPLWVSDFRGLLAIAPIYFATPTIGGLLSALHFTEAARYLIVLFLPLAWWLARPQVAVSPESAVALLTVITVPFTFYGWSYDQTILLIPIACLGGWLLSSPHRLMQMAVIFSVMVSFALNWVQRIVTTEELYYLWVPLFWAGVYVICFIESRFTPRLKI